MEKSQKRKGFMRRLYRAARSAGMAKVKQSNPPKASASLNSGGGDSNFALSSEMRSPSNPKRSVATVQKQASSAHGGFRDGMNEMRGAYSGYGGGDENVDVKAATYILLVRERLEMERSTDRKVYGSN